MSSGVRPCLYSDRQEIVHPINGRVLNMRIEIQWQQARNIDISISRASGLFCLLFGAGPAFSYDAYW